MIELAGPSGKLDVSITLPSSKSISNRLLIIRKLSAGNFQITNLSSSTDTLMLQQLIESESKEVNAGDGGTTFRFLLALYALMGKEHILSGSNRLNERPVQPLVNALTSLGANITYEDKHGFPPLHIHPSAINGGRIAINASISSQFISALLLIAPCLSEGLEIQLEQQIVSSPYIKMTVDLMKDYGIKVQWNGNVIHAEPGNYLNHSIAVEPDWSAASYWLMIAALTPGSRILLNDLTSISIQGDSLLPELSESFGVRCTFVDKGMLMENYRSCDEAFSFDFTDNPDLVPALALLTAVKGMKGTFSGIKNLRNKESDRVEALMSLITSMEGKIESVNENCFRIHPSRLSIKSVLPVFGDHRMAMSLTPLCIPLGRLKLQDHEAVKKSYPFFWDDLASAGFSLRIT